MAVLGFQQFGRHLRLGAQGACQISARTEDFPGGSGVLPTLSKGLGIVLSDFEAENAPLKGDYFWQVVESVTGGVPTLLEIHVMCFFRSLSRLLFQGSEIDESVRPNETSSRCSDS